MSEEQISKEDILPDYGEAKKQKKETKEVKGSKTSSAKKSK